MTRTGPCSARSSSPVSSATSRRAASAGGSPTFRWPFGNPQLRYESRISRNRGSPSGPRRNTTPPAEVSRWARRCLRFISTKCGVRSAECGVAGGVRSRTPALRPDGGAIYSALRIPHSAFHSFRTPHSALVLEDAEREILPRVRLDVRQELPQLDHREGGLAVQGRVRHQQAERPAAVRDA